MAEYFICEKQKIYKPRLTNYQNDNVQRLYRFKNENVERLAEYFLENINETRGGGLSKLEKMRTFLRFVGDPGFQVGIGQDIGIHQTTVSRTIKQVANAIVSKGNNWIIFPKSGEAIKRAQEKWTSKYKFPLAIGAIDCTHVRIKKPSSHSDDYINRKGYHSMNVQATCDADELFTSVEVSWPGSVHDSRILRNSNIFRTMDIAANEALLLGDNGYGLSKWLMTPFRNPQTNAEKSYNKLFKKERVIIERCFGQLKQRFPILQYKVRVATELVPAVIGSCFILHNVAKFLNDDILPVNEFSTDSDERCDEEQVFQEVERQQRSDAGKVKRQTIANALLD